jgi:hypothetical protein
VKLSANWFYRHSSDEFSNRHDHFISLILLTHFTSIRNLLTNKVLKRTNLPTLVSMVTLSSTVTVVK